MERFQLMPLSGEHAGKVCGAYCVDRPGCPDAAVLCYLFEGYTFLVCDSHARAGIRAGTFLAPGD